MLILKLTELNLIDTIFLIAEVITYQPNALARQTIFIIVQGGGDDEKAAVITCLSTDILRLRISQIV